MNAVAKLYLNQFLRAGLIFTPVMLLIDWAIEGTISLSFMEIAVRFTVYGLIWSLSMVSIHLVELKRLGVEKFTDEVLRAKHSVEVHTHLNKSELLDQLKRDPFFGKMAITKTGNEIEIIRNIFWDTNEVIVKIKPIQNEQAYSYRITCNPRLNLVQLDFGRSLECIIQVQKLVGRTSTVSAMQKYR